MKVTLVYIDSLDYFKSISRANDLSLGLAYLSASLKEKEVEVNLIDARELDGWAQLEDRLKKSGCDVAGIYVSSVGRDDAVNVARMAKKLGMVVVGGGPHATIMPDDLLETGFFDYVIQGEGEISFPKLVKDLEKGNDPRRVIKGVPVKNLDDLPFPDRGIFNLKKLLKNPSRLFPLSSPELIVMASRGCIFNCHFCQPTLNKIFGRGVRYRSVDSVICEIRFLVDEYKVRCIQFQDDTFTVRKGWVVEFTRKLKEEKLDVEWFAHSRVGTLDRTLAKEMRDAGCRLVGFGFESGSQRILNLLNKNQTVRQALDAAKICRENGLFILADIMIGNPTETAGDLEETLFLMSRIEPETLFCSVYSPIPGTYLHDYCMEKNLIKVSKSRQFDRANYNHIKGLDADTLRHYSNVISSQRKHWIQDIGFMRQSLWRWISLLKQGNTSGMISDIRNFRPTLLQKIKHRRP